MNFGENPLDSIMTFFISIIGPNTRKPIIDPTGNLVAKLRATVASEDEQRDKKNAINIIVIIEMYKFASLSIHIVFEINT